MSLIEFKSGEVASSFDINNNFSYLNNEITSLASQISTTKANFSAQVNAYQSSIDNLLSYQEAFVATGIILPFVGSEIPSGYLLCDGSELMREEFPELYAVIGTTFGSSDSTTFGLPNLVDRTLWGAGNNLAGSYLEPKLPNIMGQFRLAGTEGSSAVSGAFSVGSKGGSWGQGHDNKASNPLMKFDASTYNPIYDDEVNTVQPPALSVSFVIKY